MNNPNNDRLSSFESHTDTKKPDVRMVWLLNLIPYSGAGYIYALGFKQAIKPMMFIWCFLLIFGPGSLLPMYFILSVLGTAHLLNKNRTTADKLRLSTLGKDIDSVPPGQQIPMTSSSEFSLSTLESKAKKAKRALKRLSADGEDAKSKHAFESFEYKAQAAEKMLKARNDATSAKSFDADPAINFAPAAAPSFSDEEVDRNTAPQAVPEKSPEQKPKADTFAQSTDSPDYINQVSGSYSIDAEVANITAGVTLGANANSQEVDNFLVQESASNFADLKLAQLGDSLQVSQASEASMTDLLASADQSTSRIQSPNLVPDISTQVAKSDWYVPEVTAQYSTEPLDMPSAFSAPDVSSQSVRSDQSVPDISSQLVDSSLSAPDISAELVNSDTVVPEINSQFVDSNQFAPDISSQVVNSSSVAPDLNSFLVNSSQLAPEVSSQLVDSNQFAPDVSSQVINSNQVAPDISSQVVNSTQVTPDVSSQLPDTSLTSFGNFESPKFSFSFEDHMATSLTGEAALGTASAATTTPCSNCGAARDRNFSFCLVCGQSFL